MKSQRPPRLLLQEPIGSRTEIALPAEQANYINRVLRLRVGSTLIVFDGRGGEFLARIVSYKRGAAALVLEDPVPILTGPVLRILLMQGISKADRMDFAVQKATELGVAQIFPVHTQFSVVRLDAERAERRHSHWQKVAYSACEQSGRHFPPLVHRPAPLQDMLQTLPPGAPRLVFDPRGTHGLDTEANAPDTVIAAIGPEGGFSAIELDLLIDAGFTPVKLGEQILRTETAALVACTLLQARWGELRRLFPPGR
jgi:16S rRNA (uracil1498-N3)-methyltransferase